MKEKTLHFLWTYRYPLAQLVFGILLFVAASLPAETVKP